LLHRHPAPTPGPTPRPAHLFPFRLRTLRLAVVVATSPQRRRRRLLLRGRRLGSRWVPLRVRLWPCTNHPPPRLENTKSSHRKTPELCVVDGRSPLARPSGPGRGGVEGDAQRGVTWHAHTHRPELPPQTTKPDAKNRLVALWPHRCRDSDYFQGVVVDDVDVLQRRAAEEAAHLLAHALDVREGAAAEVFQHVVVVERVGAHLYVTQRYARERRIRYDGFVTSDARGVPGAAGRGVTGGGGGGLARALRLGAGDAPHPRPLPPGPSPGLLNQPGACGSGGL
jgi:hypothetical protein